MKLQAIHVDRDVLRNFAVQDAGFARQILLRAHCRIVARHDPFGLKKLDQRLARFRA